MASGDVTEDEPLAAGGFSAWLAGLHDALRGERDSEVPCGGCTACCRSFQFIQIGPDEVDALAHIPAELLVPAPGQPPGHLVLGHDQHGHCPMLVDDRCSIYEHRPRTCRTYDCRVFPATGIEIDDERQGAIALRARRWRFDFPGEVDERQHEAVLAAAAFVEAGQDRRSDGSPRANATQRAVLAVRLHESLQRHSDESGHTGA
ncbi:MAG: YkgJ family cysteine cluster protein [Acidimicrobiales bacterium]